MTSRHPSIIHTSDRVLEDRHSGEIKLIYRPGATSEYQSGEWYPAFYNGRTYRVEERSRGIEPRDEDRVGARKKIYALLNLNPNGEATITFLYYVPPTKRLIKKKKKALARK